VGLSEPDNAQLETILARCARQDAHALEELYARVAPLLLAVLIRMLRSRELAEDALQDVFVRVWRYAGRYEAQRGRALAWLVSIARYRAIDMQRAQKQWVGLDAVEEPVAPAARSESTLTQRALERCLELLSGEQRQCLALAYQQGLTHDGIATALGYPLGTVKSWVRRALLSLRRCLES
jgi:RNA polymerase sigma-70 factor, ECF subfamily